MESKLTGLAIGRLDAAYESAMTEYNTRKGFFVRTKFYVAVGSMQDRVTNLLINLPL